MLTTVLGMVIVVRLVHPKNTLLPIVVSPWFNVTDVSLTSP